MSIALLTQLMYCFCVLSALLLLGALLRGVIPTFQRLFLPASVIGGFIGLLIGPIIWGDMGIPFPKEWLGTWAALPGILIVPVVASVPLGMRFGGGGVSAGKTSANILKMFAIIFGIFAVQAIIGWCVREFFMATSPEFDLYAPFGFELSQGFSGGHGTAGVIGSFYRDLNLPYWELAQGVTTTTATFGLVGGMVFGIIAINIAARRGKTVLLKKPGDIPLDLAKGYQMDPARQSSMGKETTYSSSVDAVAFHFAVVLTGCGLAYIVMNLAKAYGIPGLKQIPIWAYAIVVMFGVNYVIQKIGLSSLIDNKAKGHISGLCSDFAITAAIASMPIRAIMDYIVPILTMVIIAYILTFTLATLASRYFFDNCHFERSICIWGTCTGVFLSGLMLLKICDPDYELPVLNDYSVGFSFTSVTGFVLLPVIVNFMLFSSFTTVLLFLTALLVAAAVLLVGADRISRRAN